MNVPGLTPAHLERIGRDLRGRYDERDVRLVRNQVGNLAVSVDGEYVGFVDLLTGEVCVDAPPVEPHECLDVSPCGHPSHG